MNKLFQIVFLFIFFLSTYSLHGQQVINVNELIAEEGEGLKNPDGVLLNGEWRLNKEDGTYDIAYFSNGISNGLYRIYSAEDNIIYESYDFLGAEIYAVEYDPEGNETAREEYYELKILKGKKSKKGQCLNGTFELTNLQSTYMSFEKVGDKSIYEMEDGILLSSTDIRYYENGRVLTKTISDNETIFEFSVFRKNGELLKTFYSADKYELSSYPNKITYALDYNIAEVRNGVYRFTDKNGDPLNGKYIFYLNPGDKISGLNTFIDGFKQGINYEFNTYGICSAIRMYEKGTPEGTFYINNYGISLDVEVINYKDGVKHGAELEFDYDIGMLMDSTNYAYGKKAGTAINRFSDDILYEETINYKNGEKHGKVETVGYLSSGKTYLAREEYYQYGKQTGRHLFFDSLGNITYEANYKFDKLNGLQMTTYEDSRYETDYKLGKEIAYRSYQDGLLDFEWYLEGPRKINKDYNAEGIMETLTYDYPLEHKPIIGDSVIIEYYDLKGKMYKERIVVVTEPTDYINTDDAYWEYLYDKKGNKRKRYIEEDYPEKRISFYEGDNILKKYIQPSYPEDGERRTIQYLNKQGAVVKNCQQVFIEASEEDGEWSKEKCN